MILGIPHKQPKTIKRLVKTLKKNGATGAIIAINQASGEFIIHGFTTPSTAAHVFANALDYIEADAVEIADDFDPDFEASFKDFCEDTGLIDKKLDSTESEKAE